MFDPTYNLYPIPGFAQPIAALTHLIGAAVVAVAGVFLIRHGRAGNRVWLAVFVLSAVFCLSMSGVYHMLALDSFVREQVFRRLDHAAIFVLIVGTFTAGHGILFAGWWRWGAITLLWATAATAITLTVVFFHDIPTALSLSMYLGFGWLGLVSGTKLWRSFGYATIRTLLWGGVAYTIGALVDALSHRLWIPGVFGGHEFFHLMVLLGVALHMRFLWRVADYRPAPVRKPSRLPARPAHSTP